jgi:hypothetical protein
LARIVSGAVFWRQAKATAFGGSANYAKTRTLKTEGCGTHDSGNKLRPG